MMFDKYTDRARRAMSLARQEAQRMNSEFIGTEHMLLGLVDVGGSVSKFLHQLSVDSRRIHQEVEKLITPSTSPTVSLGQLPFSPRAKRVIDLAAEAAVQFPSTNSDAISTEHLLIGLIRENEGIAAQVFVNLGFKLTELVTRIAAFVNPEKPSVDEPASILKGLQLIRRECGELANGVPDYREDILGTFIDHDGRKAIDKIREEIAKIGPVAPYMGPDSKIYPVFIIKDFHVR